MQMQKLQTLRKQYPLVNFKASSKLTIQCNESASYPFGAPKPRRVEGEFIRMENPMGGADTVLASDSEAIHRLAAWHQARAVARGAADITSTLKSSNQGWKGERP